MDALPDIAWSQVRLNLNYLAVAFKRNEIAISLSPISFCALRFVRKLKAKVEADE